MVQSLMSWYHPTSCIIACRVALPDDHGKSRTKTGFRSRSSTKSNRLSPYRGQPIPKISIESVLNFVIHIVWHMYRLCPDSTHLPRFVHSRTNRMYPVICRQYWLLTAYVPIPCPHLLYYHTYIHTNKFIQRQNRGKWIRGTGAGWLDSESRLEEVWL